MVPTDLAQTAAFVDGPLSGAVSRPLRALWHAAHGEWKAAHEEAQAGEDLESAWVHALLHREEGDAWNAAYWYRRAGRPVYRGPVTEERNEMMAALLRSETERLG